MMSTTAIRMVPRGTPRIRVREFDPYRPVRIRIPSSEKYLSEVRQLIERVAIPTWLTGEDVADLKLAATEACLNAIRHGSPLGERGTVGVVVRPRLEEVTVEVRDRGPGFNARRARHAAVPWSENGRGMQLIASLVDRAEFRRTLGGERVRLTKRSRHVLCCA